MKIAAVHGREILDSRGNPTVEVDVSLGRRRLRAGRGALGRLDRRARGPRTARRRQAAVPGQGRADGRRPRQPGPPQRAGRQRLRPAQPRHGDDRSSTARPPRAAWAPTPCSGVSMAFARASASSRRIPLYRHYPRPVRPAGRRRLADAGPDDEHPQRRRPRGLDRGLPGVHGLPHRAAHASGRRSAPAPRCSTPCAPS